MTRKWDEHPNDGKGLLRVSKMLNDEQSKTEVVPSNEWLLRERFEAWAKRNSLNITVEHSSFARRSNYENPSVDLAWEAVLALGSPDETKARIGPTEPDNDMVICPTCTSQFVAIPVNVQARLRASEETSAYDPTLGPPPRPKVPSAEHWPSPEKATPKHQPSAFDQTSPPLWDCACNDPQCAYCGPRLAQNGPAVTTENNDG